MAGGYGKGWRDFQPRTNAPPKLDRGRLRGAKWVFVTPAGDMIDYATHVDRHGKVRPADWILFRSRKEAKFWVAHLAEARAGAIRNIRRQVPFELMVKRPDGLEEIIGRYFADFVFERPVENEWRTIVQDAKGNREDLYKWKMLHMRVQYGIQIEEV